MKCFLLSLASLLLTLTGSAPAADIPEDSSQDKLPQLEKGIRPEKGGLKIEGTILALDAGSIRVRGTIYVVPAGGGIPRPLREQNINTKPDEITIVINDQTKFVGKVKLSDAKVKDHIEVSYDQHKKPGTRIATKIYIIARK